MIKNLTPQLVTIGRVKIGQKGDWVTSKTGTKFQPPVPWDHMRITRNDFTEDTELMEVVKKLPVARTNQDGNLVSIPIRLLYDDIDLNFRTRYACYSGAICVCVGDGEQAQTRDGRTVKCPCEKVDPAQYKGKDPCKMNGTLSFMIEGIDVLGGCHAFRTTGKNSVEAILGSLMLIKSKTLGRLAFLPLNLILERKVTTTPGGMPTTVSVVSVVFKGQPEELRQETLQLLQGNRDYMFSMKTIENEYRAYIACTGEDYSMSPEEEMDVALEFYPESVEKPTTVKPKIGAAADKPKPAKKKKAVTEEMTVTEEVLTQEIAQDFLQNDTTDKSAVKQEPEPKPAPARPEPTPEPEPEPEPVPHEKPTKPDTALITHGQKMEIVRLKKTMGIADLKVWLKLLKPFGVTSATQMTKAQADAFIAVLEGDDIPF